MALKFFDAISTALLVRPRRWAALLTASVLSASAMAQPVATATIPTQPGSQFIGETFKTQACFDNTGIATGFQPVLRVRVPNNLTLASAAFPTGAANNITPELVGTGAGTFVDPITGASITLLANERLYILRYPLGSVTGPQPVQCMDINVAIPLSATIGTPVNIAVTPIFSLGADALDNPATDPPIVGTGANVQNITVTPTVWKLAKKFLPPENETATGPDWPRTFTLTVDVAAGATMTSVVLDDVLPLQMQFVSSSAGAAICTTTALNTAVTTTPGGRINVNCNSVTGTASTADLVLTVTYFVPKCSTGAGTAGGACTGSKVLDPVSGAALDINNTATANGSYNGNAQGALSSTDKFTAKSQTVRKTVKILTDTGPTGLSSGDTLEYTIVGEISDYFQFQNIVVKETVGDGQTLVQGSATLSFANNDAALAAVTSAAAAIADANITTGANSGTAITKTAAGITPFQVNVSAEAITRAAGNPAAAGVFRGRDSFAATRAAQAAQYTIVYRTIVDRNYVSPVPVGATQALSAGDSVVNNVATDANVSSGGGPGALVTDVSVTSLTVVGGQLGKTIVAVNGAPAAASARVKPGDTITYSLLQTIPVGTYEDLKINDFLPLPTLSANEIVATPSAVVPATCSNPVAGTWCLGPATSITTANGFPASCLTGSPAISFNKDVAANSMQFDFPSCEPAVIPAAAAVIEVRFTVTVRNDPIADDLNLTNVSNAQIKNSGVATTSTTSIVQIKIDEPKLELKKTIVSSSNAAATRVIVAGFNDAFKDDDAGDVITYLARVSNLGRGPAYAIRVRDDFGAGAYGAAGCTVTSVKNGAGATLAFTGNFFDPVATGGLTITAAPGLPGNADGIVQANSAEYFDVLYTCTIPQTATPSATNVINNTASIANYTNSTTTSAATGTPQNFATNQTVGGLNASAAQVALRNVQSVVKSIVGSDLADTSNSPINAGEQMDFCIVTTLSEGTYTNFALTDTTNVASPASIALPALSSCTAAATSTPTCASALTSNSCVLGSNVTVAGSTITVTGSSGNTPGVIVVRTPMTAFTTSSNTGVSVTNTAKVAADNIAAVSGTTTFTVDRPNPAIAKSFSPATADAGDTVTVTLTWKNNDSDNPQYRCVITDNLNATGTNPVTPTGPFDVTSIAAATTPLGYTFSLAAGVVTYTKTDTTTKCDAATTATFTVNLLNNVPTATTYTNTAKVDVNSLPSNHPNAAAGVVESATGTGTISVSAPTAPTKLITATSVIDTLMPTDPPLAVGEIVTYQLAFSFSEGVTNNVTLIDDVTTGLTGFEYVVGSAKITRANGNITCATAANCTFASNVATVAPITSGTQLQFPLGAVTNTPGNGNATLTVELQLRVTNVAGNVSGTAIKNTGRISYANALGVVSSVSTAAVAAHVASPIVVIEKTASPAAPTGGDVVTYVVTVRNTATGINAAPAYEYIFSDTLPAALTPLVALPVLAVGATGAVATAAFTGQVLNGAIDKLDPGESITVTYKATLSTTAAFGQIINNDAKAAASSLPSGLTGTQTGVAIGTGAERTGSGGVNTLASSVKTPITTQVLTIDKAILNAKPAYAVGDLVSYRITVNAPVGSTQNLKITDSLPPGLSFNGFTAASLTAPAGFSATNNPPTSVAAPAGSCGGVAQNVTFDFGATFATPTAGAVSFDITAVVCNILGNQSAQTLANNASAVYANPNVAGGTLSASIPTPPPTITVGEPNLTVNKAVTSGATGGTAGSIVGYSVTIANSGTTAAQQATLNEVLPNNKLGNITAVTVATAGAGAFLNGTATPVTAANTVLSTTNTANDTLAFSGPISIAAGGSITVTFNAVILNGILPNEAVTNTARMVYKSQATDTAQTRDSSSGPTTVDDDDNSALNNYGEQGSSTFVAGSNIGLQKSVTPNSAVVGETVTYTVRVDIEQGTVPAVCVSDTLPANALFQSVSVSKGNLGIDFSDPSYLTNLGSGQTVKLCFGNVINAANANASDDFFEIAIVAKVRNTVANQAGVTFKNGDGTGAGQATPTVFLTWGATPTQVNFDADPVTVGFQGVPVTVKEPKLKVSKEANPVSTSLGDVVTYKVTVAHDAGSSATAFDLALIDLLPAGVDYVPGSATLPAIDVDATAAPTLKFSISSLTQAEGSKTFTYQGRINTTAVVGATLTNTVNMAWKSLPAGTGAADNARTGADGTGGALNDYATSGSAAVTVNAKAFLSATKTVAITTDNAPLGQLDAGDTVEWTVLLKNTDPAITATRVVFTDAILANTTYVASSLTSTRGVVNASADPLSVAVGAMAPGDTVTIKFKTTINAGTAAGTLISNQGVVDSDQTVPAPTDADGNNGNGAQPTTIPVGPATPVSQPLYATKQVALLTDTAPLGQITAGDTMRYTVVIFNRGNAALTGVALNDVLPAGLTYVGNTTTSGTATYTTGTRALAWTGIGSIPAGGQQKLTFDVTIDAFATSTASFINQATVSLNETPSTRTDQNGDATDGNQPTPFIAVGASPPTVTKLDAQKRVRLITDINGNGAVNEGDTIEYEIRVTNTGAIDATNVRLNDVLPGNATLDTTASPAVTTSVGSVTSFVSPIAVNIGTLTPNQTALIVFRMKANVGSAGSVIANQATLTAANAPSTSSDDNSSAIDGLNPTTIPVVGADATAAQPSGLSKTLVATSEASSTGNNALVGEVLTYEVKMELPTGTTRDVTLIDTLPANLAYVAGSGQIKRVFNTGLQSAANPGGVNTTASNTYVALTDGTDLVATVTAVTTVSVRLGDVINSDNDIDAESYVLQIKAVVKNINANQAGTTFSNTASLTYLNGLNQAQSLTPVAGPTVAVIEPVITSGKTASIGTLLTTGGTVRYTLTIENAAGGSVATAFDVTAKDVLPVSYTSATVVSVTPTGGVTGASAAFTSTTLNVSATSIPAGGKIVIVYDATAPATVTASSLLNTVAVAWTSLPGASGTASATPGVAGSDSGERTGSGAGANDYTATPTATVKVGDPQVTKTITSSNTRYAIGDTVSYQVLVSIPPGSLTNANFVDTLPAGLSYLPGTLSFTVSNPALTKTGIATDFTVTGATPANGVETLTLPLGNLANTDAAPQSYTATYNAIVDNIVENQNGQTRSNKADLNFNTPGGTTTTTITDTKSITVGEPVLTIVKSVTSPITNLDAGDVVSFKVVLTNAGTTTAFDAVVTDSLPTGLAGLTALSQTLTNTSGASVAPTLSGTATGFTGAGLTLAVGDQLEITFTAVLQTGVQPGQTIQNKAGVTYSSRAGTDANERTGADGAGGALNDYAASSLAPVITVRDPIAIEKAFFPDAAKTSYAVGEAVSYRVKVSLPEGTISNVIVTDTLPVGLTFISATVSAGNVAMTLGSSAVTGPVVGVLTANIGTVTNPGDADSSNDFVVLDVTARVSNIVANQNSSVLVNNARVSYSDALGTIKTLDYDRDSGASGIQGLPLTVAEPDVALTKVATPTSVSLGDEVLYTLKLDHSATSTADAYQLVVIDTLPAGLSYAAGSASLAPSSIAGQVITWTVGALTRVADILEITYRAKVSNTVALGASLNNSATLSYKSTPVDNPDTRTGADGPGGPLNDYAGAANQTITTNINIIEADKTASYLDANGNGQLDPGEVITWTIVLTNDGGAKTNVVFTDTVPANTTYVAASLSSSSPGAIDSGAPLLSVNVGPMIANATVIITFKTTVNAGTPAGTVISNQGVVDSDQTVPEPTDSDKNDANGDQPTTLVVGPVAAQSALVAAKTVARQIDADGSASNTAGDTMRYSIVLRNAGAATLSNVGFVDQIPTGLTYVTGSLTPTAIAGGTASQSAGIISLSGASLVSGASLSFTFDVTIDAFSAASKDFTNQGTATSDQTQPIRTDNNGDGSDGNQPTVFAAVNPDAPPATLPALNVQKRAAISVDANGNGIVNPGDRVTFSITVKNTSTVTATNVRFTDALPVGELTYIGPVTVSQGVAVTSGPSSVDANLGTLAGGATATITYSMEARADSAGKVASNQASVTSAETGATQFSSDNNGDQSDGVNPTLVPIENPATPGVGTPTGLTKSIINTSEAASIDPAVLIGEVVTYRIGVNLPAGLTRNANIIDTLPLGMAYVAGSATLSHIFNVGLSASGNPGAINAASIGVAVALTDALHVITAAQTVTVALGDVTNSDNDADAESYTLIYKAVVQNNASNNAGVDLVNSATLAYNNALNQPAALAPATTSVRVTEAQLVTQKSANPGTLLPSGGNVTYTVTVTNPAGADRATAFDVKLTDTLPTPRVTAVTSVSCAGASGVVVSNTAATLPTVGCDVSSFAVGGSLTLTYTATYSAVSPTALAVGDSLPNTANTAWTSLPGNNGSASANPGAAGTLTGERTGGGTGSNDLTSSATANVNVGVVTLAKSIVNPKSAYAIGDEVDYSVLVSIPGNINRVTVLDTLDAGLLYKSGSLTVAKQSGLTFTPATPADFTAAGQNLSLALGAADVGTPVSVKTVTLTYKAIVRNVIGNWTGASLGNAARATYQDPGNPAATITTATDRKVVTVGEPLIALAKAIVSAPTPVNAGTVITYDVTVANAGTTAGFETIVTDTFPATLANATVLAVTPNFSNGSPTAPTITPSATGWASSPFTLNAGDSVVIRFTAVVQTGVQPGQAIVNAVVAAFSSQLGANPNERTGADGIPQSDRTAPNNYNVSATAPAVTAINPVTLSKAIFPDATRTRYAIGETVGYRLRVALLEGTVNNLVVSDALPAGLSVVSAALSSGNTGITTSNPFSAPAVGATGTLTFNLGIVTNPANGNVSDDFVNIDVIARVDNVLGNQSGTTLANTASLDYNTASGPALTVTTPPVGIAVKEPVVQLLKTTNLTAVSLGDEIIYTLTLDHTSASTADAFNLVVSDTLPAGLTYSAGSASVAPTSVVGQTITWNIGALTLAQDQTSITFRARLALTAAIGTPLTNNATLTYTSIATATAAVGRTGADGVGGLNDYASSAAAPITPSDIRSISASKTVVVAIDADGSGGLTAGDTLEYTIVLTNRAATAQTNVVFTDSVPLNTTYVAATLSSSKGSINDVAAPLLVNVGSMVAGEAVTVKFRVRVNSNTAPSTVIRNQGSVDSDQIVPTRTDDPTLPGTADPTDIVVGGLPPVNLTPAMTVSKTAALSNDVVAPIGTINVGDSVTFTMIVQNSGNVALTGVTLTDAVPAAFTVTATSANASFVGNAVTANIGNLAVNAQVAVTVTAITNSAGSFTNQASVVSTQTTAPTLSDFDPVQPGAQPTPVVVLPANATGVPALAVSKSVAISVDANLDGRLNAGESIRYTIVVRNSGTALANNVVLSDTLPPGLTLIDVSPSQGAVVSGTSTNIVVNLGSIGPSALATLTITAGVPTTAPIGATFTNTATATGIGIAPAPSNPVSIVVQAPASVAPPLGTKQGFDRGFPVIEWRQVWINAGSGNPLRMRIVDPVDASQTFSPGTLICTPTGSSIVTRCAFDALTKQVIVEATLGPDLGNTTEATAANEVVITFRVNVSTAGSFSNTAGAYWDRNGNGDINDDVLFGLLPINAAASVATAPVDIPTMNRYGLCLLLLALLLLSVSALQREPRRRAASER